MGQRRYVELPVVERRHYAAPALTETQGRAALRLGLDLQEAADALAPEHARLFRQDAKRFRIHRLTQLVLAADAFGAILVAGGWFGWWPGPAA